MNDFKLPTQVPAKIRANLKFGRKDSVVFTLVTDGITPKWKDQNGQYWTSRILLNNYTDHEVISSTEPLADWERDLLGPQTDGERYWFDKLEERSRESEKHREAAEKAIRMIEKATDVLERYENDEWNSAKTAVREVCAVLLEKDFKLPTKVGSGIKGNYHSVSGHTAVGGLELRLFANGKWVDEEGDRYEPEEVLRRFKNLEIVEED